MKKPLHRQALDQLAHFVAAFVICLIVVWTPVPWNFMLLGLALGAVREITEGGNVLSTGSLLDMTFWALGGLVFGIIFI